MGGPNLEALPVKRFCSVKIADAPEQTGEIVHGRHGGGGTFAIDFLADGEGLPVERFGDLKAPQDLVKGGEIVL